ncbi:hypothetical protein [Mesorhizobium australicum]|uniref:hypothetical protein n=1 Tax=Mesorhizobium australicum TaxID=536018 RepID=UPI0033362B22
MMRERLQEFALQLHPDKTRLVEFGRSAADTRKRKGLGRPETFDFLALPISAANRRGRFQIHRNSRGNRRWAKLKETKVKLQRRMYHSILEQWK